MPNYGAKRYWDKRYKAKDQIFEWLENYEELKDIINKHCTKDAVVLNLGCGNSVIQEDMYDDGYKNIYNIDISDHCIQQMEERKGARKELVYEVMDCTQLKYEDEMFDFVIDKSTIDALLCGEDSYLNVAKMMSEVQRVLKPGGIYLIVSYGEPYNRTFHFERDHIDFSFTSQALPPKDAQDGSGQKQNPHYAYTLKKGPNANKKHADHYQQVIEELIKEEEEARLKYGTSKDDDEDYSDDEQNKNNEKEDDNEEVSSNQDDSSSNEQNTDSENEIQYNLGKELVKQDQSSGNKEDESNQNNENQERLNEVHLD